MLKHASDTIRVMPLFPFDMPKEVLWISVVWDRQMLGIVYQTEFPKEEDNMFLKSTLRLDTLQDLFVSELKDIYDAETQVMEAMPKLIDAATSDDLQNKFRQHRDQTRTQMDSLEDIFEMMDMEPQREHCDGMAGILKDLDKVIRAEGDTNVKDAALIAEVQKVEHYEIASYGTLRTFAQTMGHSDYADKLQMTLEQAAATDKILSDFAMRSVNVRSPQM